MTSEHLPIILLGLFASGSFIASNFVLTRTRTLLFGAAGMTALIIQYSLQHIWTVVLINTVFLARNLLLLANPTWTQQTLQKVAITSAAALILGNLLTGTLPTTVTQALPLLAGISSAIAFTTTRPLLIKIFLGVSSGTWLTFGLLIGNWQNAIGDAFATTAALTAITRLLLQTRTPPQQNVQTTGTLIYDGNCGFCSTCVRWLTSRTLHRLDATPYQWADLTGYGLTREQAAAQVYVISEDKPALAGSDAIAECLRWCRNPLYRAFGRILTLAWIRPVAQIGYRLIARYRHRLPGGTPTCKLPR